MQVIVLGMHRAGTSAVTRLINLMGAYIGPENQFLPATADNPKGYWERIDVLQLHEWLLEQLGADWYLVSNVNPQQVEAELYALFKQRAQPILQGLEGNRPWIMKDPRLCILLPLWLPLLEAPICVHVVRHPLTTAQSLAKRDGFPLHFGITLWEHHAACSLIASSGLPRFSICYEQLMEKPVAVVKTLYENLKEHGVQGIHLPTEREICGFIDDNFQHHIVDDQENEQWLTRPQIDLWNALRDSRLAELDQRVLHDPARLVRLQGYETLLRSGLAKDQTIQEQQRNATNQYAVIESLLDEKNQLLSKNEQLFTEQQVLSEKHTAACQSLMRLFEILHHDTEIAFASLSWRLGFAIAHAGRSCGLLKKTPLVQDHIAQLLRYYQAWQKQHGFINDDELPDSVISAKQITQVQAYQEMRSWSHQPLISIIMPVYNVAPRWLEAAISSVQQQIYPNWELCIADDASSNAETLNVLRNLNHPRCKIKFLEHNQGIAGASNAALALASGEYVAFLDNDDQLTPDALYQVAKVINEENPDFIYSDEDKLSLAGKRLQPHFKPDYSADLLLGINYICHLSVYRRTLLDKLEEAAVTGQYLRQGFEGAQDHDLVLRALEHTENVFHISQVLYHWRMIPGSTAASYDSKDHAWEAGRRAVADALQRRGIIGEALLGKYPGTYRVKRAIQGQPLISILIPFRDQPALLQECLDSILLKTTYAHFEILGISNHSENPETFALMEHYASTEQRIRFINYDQPFNYSAINNFAVNEAAGEHVVLLNNDITVITPDWLEALLEHSQRPEVGAVGAKLYYPDDTIQHGGVIIGVGGIAGHAHKYFSRQHPGYFSRLHLIQNLSAVTAACLMVKKAVYTEVGGLDAKNLSVAFNDVDFCLRLRERGYLNVFTPYCELYHHESKTRGYEDTPDKKRRFAKEVMYIKKRHAAILHTGDPYYSPNLPLDREDFGML